MKKILLLMGPSGSGKTTFAKRYAKEQDAEYLDFDTLFNYKRAWSFSKFLENLNSLIASSKKQLFVIDGYILYNSPSPKAIEKKLNVEVQLGLCFAAPHILLKRNNIKIKEGKFKHSWTKTEIEHLINIIFAAISTQNTKDPLFIDTSTGIPERISLDKFQQRWQELIFTDRLTEAQHDKYYQEINLPSGITIQGYSESEETWKRLSSLINFTDKSVVDFGPFHGFMSFRAEEAGAKYVVGVENNIDALKTAQHISWLKNSGVLFIDGDIETFSPSQQFDVALVLNMLHYANNQRVALKTVFSSANTVVFEINIDQEILVSEEAKKHGFEIISMVNSGRELRKILIFQNSKGEHTIINKHVEGQFALDRKRYLMQTIIKRIKQSKIMSPIRHLVKRCRQKKFNSPHIK